eukprot:4035850-Pyramimonas_sp.AAC.1
MAATVGRFSESTGSFGASVAKRGFFDSDCTSASPSSPSFESQASKSHGRDHHGCSLRLCMASRGEVSQKFALATGVRASSTTCAGV